MKSTKISVILVLALGLMVCLGKVSISPAATPGKGGGKGTDKAANRLVHSFVLDSDETVSAGDVVALFSNGYIKKSSGHMFNSASVFNSAETHDISVTALSETKFIVTYRDYGNSNYGTVVVGDVSGTSISFGPEYVFTSSCWDISAAALSETKFVVAYRDYDNSSYGTAIVGEVSGSTISFGTEYVFNSGTTTQVSVTALTETKFVVAYRDGGNSNYGTAAVGEVSGNTISFGAEYVFNSAQTDDISVAALTDTKFVVSYRDYDNSGYGTAVVGEVSGNTISFGSEYVFNSAITISISVAALTDTKFIVAYFDYGNSYYGTAVIGEVSGSTISFGTEYVFNDAYTYDISVAALTDTKFVVTYSDSSNFYCGTAVVGEVSGNTIAFGPEDILDSTTVVSSVSIAQLAEDMFVVSYFDGARNSGSARTGMPMDELGIHMGIAEGTASAGESVPVIIEGISDNHLDLVPGQFYYSQSDGSLTLEPTIPRIGVAISPTELLVDVER